MYISPKMVTVVIPTRNEAKNISAFLKSLPGGVPLIVIDSSDDETSDLIRKMRPENTILIQKKCNIPQARQLGAETVQTPWILFSDADIIFEDDYFDQLSTREIPEDVGAVMGAKLSREHFKLYLWFYSFSIGLYAKIGLPMGSGSNMLVRREAFLKTSGFDPLLSTGEDTYMLWQVKQTGFKVIYNPMLKVYETDHRRLEKGVFKKIVHGTSRALMLFSGLAKERVRNSDWGYWTPKGKDKK